ncbi:hypothetical protein IV203_011379 [Nitzschia inconspicua]|uniref:Uncharacterized protein n=1 Tax=Nitzschia inconspicua TaxID=303405 RepID=A0A9K3KS81_9STRA|nr:hypothetical protein IV203_011379 [Nitzschia inconspicua]
MPTEPDYVFPFRLNIYMVSEDAPVDAWRWFVSHINVNKRTCAWHRGHIRPRPSELHNYLTNMPEEEKKHTEQFSKLRFSTSSTAALLCSRSAGGLTYQANQILYLSRAVCDIGKHGQSTADQLVSTFSKRTDPWIQSQRQFSQTWTNTGATSGNRDRSFFREVIVL